MKNFGKWLFDEGKDFATIQEQYAKHRTTTRNCHCDTSLPHRRCVPAKK